MLKTILLLTFVLICPILASQSSIKIIPPQSQYDASHDYFKSLLTKILDVTKDEYGNSQVDFSSKMEQGRAFLELQNKRNLDIHWAGTSLQREEEFRAIKIPLVKGLLGYRLFIINENKVNLFDTINSLEDLKQLKACQGKHWPDTKILENSGLKVVKNSKYEPMFLQVEQNRCDYFPRGVHEIVSEVNARVLKYPSLMMYKNMIVYYPFPMYFFVHKDNEDLAKRVEEGLLKLIENKEFDEFIKNHEVTKHLFPLNDWMDVKVFEISNPFMNIEEKYYNDKFWIFNK